MTTCKHCDRVIVLDNVKGWIDPQANGDDSVWRETCDSHDTFTAEHEPFVIGAPVTIDSDGTYTEDDQGNWHQVTAPFNVVGFIMAFESGDDDMTQDEVVEGFQHLIDTGIIYGLQGFYGRYAAGLAAEGLVTL